MSFLKYQKQNPEFLNNYLKYKAYIEFKSKTTADATYFDLRTMLRYIKLFLYNNEKLYTITAKEFVNINISDITLDDLRKITKDTLEKYIVFLGSTLNNNNKTCNRKLTSARKFFEFLENNNLIYINPTKGIESSREDSRLPKYLSLDESKQLLSNTIKSNHKYKIRNYAITCIFLNCSIRLSELTAINLGDFKIDNSEQTLKVRGKGNKERLLYLNTAVCESILKYLEVRPHLEKTNKDYNALFISNQYKRISNRAVQCIIKEELLNTIKEDEKKYHTHSLRHSGATLMYNESDINIFVLKRILGHDSLKATEIYTHVSDKKLKYIMQNCTISSIIERNGGKI